MANCLVGFTIVSQLGCLIIIFLGWISFVGVSSVWKWFVAQLCGRRSRLPQEQYCEPRQDDRIPLRVKSHSVSRLQLSFWLIMVTCNGLVVTTTEPELRVLWISSILRILAPSWRPPSEGAEEMTLIIVFKNFLCVSYTQNTCHKLISEIKNICLKMGPVDSHEGEA